MNNLTPEQLAFRAGYEQGRFDAQVETAQQRHISYVCPQCHWSLDKQPAQQQEPVAWIGLTDEERAVIVEANTTDDHGYDIWCDGDGVARVVEAKLKEKNT